MRMLIVEDEKDLCNILKKRLQKDYTIDICMDGEIAKDYLNTYTYDIILLDIMLPKIDGRTTGQASGFASKKYSSRPKRHSYL